VHKEDSLVTDLISKFTAVCLAASCIFTARSLSPSKLSTAAFRCGTIHFVLLMFLQSRFAFCNALGIHPIWEINYNSSGLATTQSRSRTAGVITIRRKLG
jgi:hypothetical protein